jgi:hypothetical protein
MFNKTVFTDPINDWIHILYLNTKQLVWHDNQMVMKAYFNTYLELLFFVDQTLKKFRYEDQTPTNCCISLQDSVSLPG